MHGTSQLPRYELKLFFNFEYHTRNRKWVSAFERTIALQVSPWKLEEVVKMVSNIDAEGQFASSLQS